MAENGKNTRVIFIDRDGTINRDEGYTHKVEDFELLPYALEGLQALSRAGYKLIIVTNQAGIGRGYYGEDDMCTFHERLCDHLKKAGVHIEGIYHCPHHPDDGCECRKPKTGMIDQAKKELAIDISQSWMIGDTPKDIEVGKNAELKTIKIGERIPNEKVQPDYHAPNLLEAAYIIETHK